MSIAHLLIAALLPQDAPPAPERVEVVPAVAEIEVDAARTFRAEVFGPGDARIEGAEVRWILPDGEIARVDEATGEVTALRPGETQVFAVVGGKAGRATVRVPELPATSLEVTMAAGPIRAGESAQASIVGRTRLGEAVPTPVSSVRSEDERVAVADPTGRVYGLREGRTSIEFRSGDATSRLAVEVVANPADGYRMTGLPAGSVRTGDVVRLGVTALDGGRPIGPIAPAWLTDRSDADVFVEGPEGVFVAEGPGDHLVTALVGRDRVVTGVIHVEPRPGADEAEIVLLGRGVNADHHSGDTWAFEGVDGRDYAYIGTFLYDWMRVWDVTDPTAPVLTDSIRLDARRINDVKIHPSKPIGIVTREGASDRRNGIVLLDLSEPARPTILSEYEETVTGGVHNVWIDGEHDLVYACHNGTSELHIIDISDPENPSEVGRWGIEKRSKTLHDVIVQDGYAYLSYWDDGLVILDAGAGTHGGTPTDPVFVSNISYPAGHTHTAFRYGRYVFVGDEIFPAEWDPEKPIEARGYIHVIDVADIDAPVEVARYEVPEAGAHNIWVADDRLWVGYYQAGLRVVDVSGELRGDLYRQGRELAVLKTGAAESVVPNWGMTWGAQPHKGAIFTSDLNSGLWIARLRTQPLVP